MNHILSIGIQGRYHFSLAYHSAILFTRITGFDNFEDGFIFQIRLLPGLDDFTGS